MYCVQVSSSFSDLLHASRLLALVRAPMWSNLECVAAQITSTTAQPFSFFLSSAKAPG
jgi:hypothetical protein